MAAVCPHIEESRLPIASASSKVYKDECLLCFDSQMPNGINVCMTCFNGGCSNNHGDRSHADLHYRKASHALVLNVKRIKKAASRDSDTQPQKITKLAIQEEDDSLKYDLVTKVICLACGNLEIDSALPKIKTSVDGILQAVSAKKQSEIQSWQEETLRPCSHTKDLVQTQPRKLEGKAFAHCQNCDLQENLWLCLSCGNIGCGRAQYGGLGGNGHALSHFDAENHPIAVKLGTITPEGTADLFCYAHANEVINSNLSAHLSTFGINLMSQQKTEKSIAELQLEQNLKFDFSMTTEDGKIFTPMFGPGFTGLKNLGNSCYMASVLQVLFALDPFKTRYNDSFESHTSQCHELSAKCFHCQMGKIADGLMSGRYSIPIIGDDGEERGQEGIAPLMFKTLIGHGHHEFSTMRQQDAQEFLQYLLTTVEQKERSSGNDPSQAFRFKLEQRLQCLECTGVRYKTDPASSIMLSVPARVCGEEDGKKQYESVSLDECLHQYFEADMRQYECPCDKTTTTATFVQRFHSYPSVLSCAVSRFVPGDSWVMEKLNVELKVSEQIDLSQYRACGKLPNETLLPEEPKTGSAEIQIDAVALEQLMSMGFPENRCKRSLIKTGNTGPDAAMNWLMEHMDDPDIDDPITSVGETPSACTATEADISQLMDMGFSLIQAKTALGKTANNLDRAVDWLFSHSGSDMPMDDEPIITSNSTSADDTIDQGLAKYNLFAIISHRGTSAHCGHYVAFIKHGSQWVMYNDSKVVKVPDMSNYIGQGYIYLYKRE
ncbi:hypothetical protein BDEG_24304 [Batrachochytrium dendrobatidis JEL423]|uniref:Ubiquitin carboxyl-terminal hydrolase n=1 Tax=Batrachochytrium dendrobatidis (strain JEL423) TaxID=403673 RepID=A0A177WKF9_BATDL|nr:hypothetical protein BDEG_24304 [Batrachochytrium dendrobatidis JEL423]